MRRALVITTLLQFVGCAHEAPVASGGGNPDSSGAAASAGRDLGLSLPETLGRAFMEHLARGDYAPAEAMFTDEMKATIPLAGLESRWANTVRDMGAFEAIEGTRVEPWDKGVQVLVTCRFARGPQTYNVVLDSSQRVAGLWPRAVIPVGRAYVWRLSRHDYDAACGLSDAKMQASAPPAKLAQLWTSLEAENGAFNRIISVKNEGDATVVVAFADKSVTFSVCVDGLAKVCGFHIVGATKRSGLDTPEPQLDFERQDSP
jgi:Protein of unknown function (DUF3887)